jgi:5-formyltetrahydrofolate cyclo-ligase
MHSPILKKSDLRKSYLQKRDLLLHAMSLQEREQEAWRAFTHLKHWLRPSLVLMYAPIRAELDCLSFLEELQKHSRVAFPRVEGENLVFVELQSRAELKAGRYNPEPTGQQIVRDFKNSLVLVPGVVFGREGQRIGFGRGYYDRFLAEQPGITRLGLAYDFQLCLDAWEQVDSDQAMDAVVCPSGIWGSERKVKLGYSPRQ